MGLWDKIKRALGLGPVVFRDDEPVTLSTAAEQRLASLPEGHGITLALLAVPAGWMLQVTEGPTSAPRHAVFEGHPVSASDDVVDRLRGLTLDHTDGHWQVITEVKLSAKETPNPDGRAYLTDRRLASGRLWFTKTTEGAPWLIARLIRRDDIRNLLVRDNTLTVERTPDADWGPIDLAVSVAIREHILSAGGTLTPPADAVRADGLEAAVWRVMEANVLPILHRDGGDLELISIEQGVVRIHLIGACRTCPASTLTVKGGIEKMLKEAFPNEIHSVESVA